MHHLGYRIMAKNIRKVLAAIGLSYFLLPAHVHAQTYSWSISETSGLGSGSGTFSVSSGLITGITGSFANFSDPLRNGTIESLIAVGGYVGNDNVYNATAPYLTYDGVSFIVGGNSLNLYYFEETQSYFYSYFNPGEPENFVEVLMAEGVDAENTIFALTRDSLALQNIIDRQLAYMAMMANYDCSSFDKNGICMSFNARGLTSDGMSEGAGVLTAAYRLHDKVRVGAFADYAASEQDPTGVQLSKQLPTFGAFLGYSQNRDRTGLQGKVIAALRNDDATISRIGDEISNTETGTGKASLNSFVLAGELGWGFATSQNLLVTPYVSVRYSDASRGAYTEAATDLVAYPVSYDEFAQNVMTATAGVRLSGMMTEKVGYQIAAAIEQDIYRQISAYSGTSEIVGLEDFSLETTEANSRTRAIGSVGLAYQAQSNMRLTTDLSVQSQAVSNQAAVSAMVGYQVAF